MSTSISSRRQSISHSSHASGSERSVSSDEIDEKNSDADGSVELTSTIKSPTLETKTKKTPNNRELLYQASTSERSADRTNSVDASNESNGSDETVVSQESQAPTILANSEPRLVARTNNFFLIASALTGLSAPFVMMLGPKDLASRASWFGVAAVTGLIMGSAYCFGDYVNELREQVQAQQRGEASPA